MNCPKCGAAAPQGAQACPVCGEPLAGYAGYQQPGAAQYPGYNAPPASYGAYPQQPPYAGYPQQGQAQPGAYQQPPQAAYQQPVQLPQPTQPNAYPQGYQQAYRAYVPAGHDPNPFLTALGNLPRVLSELFRDPGEVLSGMVERGDAYTGLVAVVLTLLLTFLSAMAVASGLVRVILTLFAAMTGASAASDAAGFSQGVSYIAGRIGPSLGGVAVLCQLLAMLLPAGVLMVYACVKCRVRFSLPLLSSTVALTTLPSVGASLLCMLLSLLSPALSGAALLFGTVTSYIIMGALIGRVSGKPDAQLTAPRLGCICLCVLLKLLFMVLVGGALMGGVSRTVLSLLQSMSSLM
ncbi:MAG: hypothetical protein PHY12_10735 [Eubacteriales bacterium]|nr:hypothetical protein [Eubacteriales bacterium]